MEKLLSYTLNEPYKIRGNLIERIPIILNNECSKIINSSLSSSDKEDTKKIKFMIEDVIFNIDVTFDIEFNFTDDYLNETIIKLYTDNDEINEYHLKNYLADILSKIIRDEFNEKLNKYTVRTYTRIFNSHPLRGDHLINGEYKVLIKSYEWNSKLELLTEQIVMFDTEVEAVNLDHARSLAYNNTKNITAYLSLLLDIGFELITSEFRIFLIKEGSHISLHRYRTGFIDYELDLLIKDNHEGMKILELNEVNSFFTGKESFSLYMPGEDGSLTMGDPFIFNKPQHDPLVEVFKDHKIKRKKSKSHTKPEVIPISKEPHFQNQEIKIPSAIRKYFKSIDNTERRKKDAFLSCARMYNISLTTGMHEPTLEKSYKICAIEALSKYEGISFSEFLIKYGPDDLDKKLTDYYYSIRSGHFHSGKFYFDEYDLTLLREVAFSLRIKTEDFMKFDRYIRFAIVSWIEENLIT